MAPHKFKSTLTRELFTCFQQRTMTKKVRHIKNREHAQPMVEMYSRLDSCCESTCKEIKPGFIYPLIIILIIMIKIVTIMMVMMIMGIIKLI